MVDNEVTRAAGVLRFGEMNCARTGQTPSWLANARRSGTVRIALDIEPQQSQGPASIMMLARDYWHGDFAIVQEGSDLLLWLRRPGSDANGDPPFVIEDAFASGRWSRIRVIVRHDQLGIDVNGVRRLNQQVPAGTVNSWVAGQVALGGEVHGGNSWRGQIRQAEVRTAGRTIDYTRPDTLSIPPRFFYLPDHVAPFPPEGRGEWETFFLHGLSFIAVGLLIVSARRGPPRVVPATAMAVVLGVALGAGKFLFYGRHTAAGDIVAETLGACAGAFMARSFVMRQHVRPPNEAPNDYSQQA
jgi:hypothetical protein